jgi:hypothetical protein
VSAPTAPEVLDAQPSFDLVPEKPGRELHGFRGHELTVVVRAKDVFGLEPARLSYVVRAYAGGRDGGKAQGQYLQGVQVLPKEGASWTTYSIRLAYDAEALDPSGPDSALVARMLLTVRTTVRYALGAEETAVQRLLVDGTGAIAPYAG